MCRWMAYSGPPIFLDTVLFEADNSLVRQSLNARWSHVVTNGDGFGIGWYGEREAPGLYRDILPAWNDANLRELAEQVRSRLFFAHVRAATTGATARTNCHPFRHDNWLFMHNGAVGEFSRLRRELDLAIPEELYPFKEGTTDSETIFYLLLANGLDIDPAGAYAATVDLIEKTMVDHGIDAPFRLAAVATDGNRLLGIRYSSDGRSPSLFYGRGADEVEDAVMIMSEPADEAMGRWAEVPEGSLVHAAAGDVRIEPFRV